MHHHRVARFPRFVSEIGWSQVTYFLDFFKQVQFKFKFRSLNSSQFKIVICAWNCSESGQIGLKMDRFCVFVYSYTRWCDALSDCPLNTTSNTKIRDSVGASGVPKTDIVREVAWASNLELAWNLLELAWNLLECMVSNAWTHPIEDPVPHASITFRKILNLHGLIQIFFRPWTRTRSCRSRTSWSTGRSRRRRRRRPTRASRSSSGMTQIKWPNL